MKRREFITLLGGAAAAWPLAASAQEPARIYRLGAIIPIGRQSPAIAAFFDEMRLFGFIEGQNLTVLPNGFGVRNDELDERAEALVKATPDVIISGPDNYTHVLQQRTRTIPLVAMTEDMLRAGLVNSLARPGGNITGISPMQTELMAKRLELLSDLVPQARVIALLVATESQTERVIGDVQEAARAKGVELPIVRAGTESEIDTAFASLAQLHAGGLVVAADPFLGGRRDQLVALASRHAAPAIYAWREFAAGGLISYGSSIPSNFRGAGAYVGRILNGAKPADLPVQQPTRFELVVNLETAKELGLTIPPAILARADEVIE